jgi:hypothetical protein
MRHRSRLRPHDVIHRHRRCLVCAVLQSGSCVHAVVVPVVSHFTKVADTPTQDLGMELGVILLVHLLPRPRCQPHVPGDRVPKPVQRAVTLLRASLCSSTSSALLPLYLPRVSTRPDRHGFPWRLRLLGTDQHHLWCQRAGRYHAPYGSWRREVCSGPLRYKRRSRKLSRSRRGT